VSVRGVFPQIGEYLVPYIGHEVRITIEPVSPEFQTKRLELTLEQVGESVMAVCGEAFDELKRLRRENAELKKRFECQQGPEDARRE
jgi:hypothetical protein